MKKLMLFLSLFVMAFALHAQQGMSKADLKSEENAIREISKNWLDLERNKDYSAMAGLFADDAVLYRPNHEPVKGSDAIKSYFSEQGQKNPKEVVDWSTDRVDVANSGELAVEYGKFTTKNSGLSGNESDKGNYVTVYRKDSSGKWKVVADIVNSTSPSVSPM